MTSKLAGSSIATVSGGNSRKCQVQGLIKSAGIIPFRALASHSGFGDKRGKRTVLRFGARNGNGGTGQTTAIAGFARPVSFSPTKFVSLAASGYLSCESSILTGRCEVIQQCEQLMSADSPGDLCSNGLAVMF